MQDQNEVLLLLDEWEKITLNLEESPSLSEVHQAFQTVHSLKGLLSLLGYQRASKAVHEKEELLDAVRRTNDFSKLNTDAVLQFIDSLRQAISQGSDWNNTLAKSSIKSQPIHYFEWKKPLSTETIRLIKHYESEGKKLWVLQKTFSTTLNDDQWARLPLFKNLAEVGALICYDPRPEDWNRQNSSTVLVSFLFCSAKNHEELNSIFYDPVLPAIIPNTISETAEIIQQKPSSQLKILILEDDKLTLMLLTQIFARNYKISSYERGNEAWEEWLRASHAGEPYNVIILDLMIPDLSGFEVLKLIRDWENANNVDPKHRARVFVNSALDDKQSVEQASQYQADGYFFKPYSIDKIMSTLERIKGDL